MRKDKYKYWKAERYREVERIEKEKKEKVREKEGETYQHILCKGVEGNKGGEPSHELRDHTELDEVLSLNVRKQPEKL